MVISPEVIETFLQYRDFFSLKAEQLYEFLVKYSYPNLRGEIFQDVYCTDTHYVFCYAYIEQT